MKEASEQMWSTCTLNRNVSTQYYERRLACQREHLSFPAPDITDNDSMEYIKNSVVAVLMGFLPLAYCFVPKQTRLLLVTLC